MKTRPIIFNGPMVRAILDGRKTETRRVVKPRPEINTGNVGDVYYAHDSGYLATNVPVPGGYTTVPLRSPYGGPGDRLWVKETFCPVNDTDHGGVRWVDYRATPRYSAEHPAGWDNAPDDAEALKWRPSIFMPRWASRITLDVTDVHAERLQSINTDSIIAEGIEVPDCAYDQVAEDPWVLDWERDCYARRKFTELWDSINEKRGFSWDSNPFVWVVQFELAETRRPRRCNEGSDEQAVARRSARESNGRDS